jgi:hypothetical protein
MSALAATVAAVAAQSSSLVSGSSKPAWRSAPVTPVLQATMLIKVLVTNPKRGASAARFASYAEHTTVGAYIKAHPGYGTADLRWDERHGFISLHAPVSAEPSAQ